jgi:hypothetical protein
MSPVFIWTVSILLIKMYFVVVKIHVFFFIFYGLYLDNDKIGL